MSSTANIFQSSGAFDGSSRGDLRVVIHSARAEINGRDLPAEQWHGDVPMTFAYVEAYAAARSCLGALADISDFEDSCRYERLLIDLDGSHGGDFPATYPVLGTRPELLAHLEDEVDRMIKLGGDGSSNCYLPGHWGGESISHQSSSKESSLIR